MATLPIFVYGTLMSGQVAFDRLAAASRSNVAGLLQSASLYALDWYPMATDGEGTVIGELHWLAAELSVHVLAALDAYEGDEYTRIVRTVTRLDDGAPVDAWVYLGDPAVASRYPQIVSGDWRAFHG